MTPLRKQRLTLWEPLGPHTFRVPAALCLLVLSCLTFTDLASRLFALPPQSTRPSTHTDESQVPPYTLPDPLRFDNGDLVETVADWQDRRRPEILKLFAEQMYGVAPPAPERINFKVVEESSEALNGKAIRKQIAISLTPGPAPVVMTMLLYVPKSVESAPVFWGLNFRGNQAVTSDPAVLVNPNWMTDSSSAKGEIVNNRATEMTRGKAASRWPIELLIDRGYALATAYYGDIDPDFDDGFQNGVHPAFYRPGQTRPDEHEWGAIAAWAWGLSRGLDYLQQEPLVNGNKVAAIGHSRLGKTALWAGATDQRFALVISNNSGSCGAALEHRIFGETLTLINFVRPHWLCGNFKHYNNREADLPVDAHELIALIAPRPVYIASASEDLAADPKGEFLAAAGADPVYRLLGTNGFGSADLSTMPVPETPLIDGTIGYHVRTGKHDITITDWRHYLDFADRYLKK